MVSPGVIQVRTRDYAGGERTYERQVRDHRADVNMAAAYLSDGQGVPELLPIRETIVAVEPEVPALNCMGATAHAWGAVLTTLRRDLLPRVQSDRLGADRPQQPAAGSC